LDLCNFRDFCKKRVFEKCIHAFFMLNLGVCLAEMDAGIGLFLEEVACQSNCSTPVSLPPNEKAFR
jgi:hypothetical protein